MRSNPIGGSLAHSSQRHTKIYLFLCACVYLVLVFFELGLAPDAFCLFFSLSIFQSTNSFKELLCVLLCNWTTQVSEN